MKSLLCLLSLFLLSLGASCSAADVAAFRCGDELAICFNKLDVWRQSDRALKTEITLNGKQRLAIDLADPAITYAVTIDVKRFGPCDTVSVRVDGQAWDLLVGKVETLPSAHTRAAAIERGSKWSGNSPIITLPDLAKARHEKLAMPARSVELADITFPVVSGSDLPVLGSQNVVLLVNERIFFSYRKAVIDEKTLRVKRWQKFLVEVPVDPKWASGLGDEVITLPRDDFTVHTTDELALNGSPMLGSSAAGLAQGGQSCDTDEQGRIYFSNVEQGAGLVRFDPRSKKFEHPPVNFVAEITKLLPPDPIWRRAWDTALMELLVMRGRVFIAFARNHRVISANGNVEVCSGVISAPQDHWDDAAKFTADMRLHAGCWEGAPHQLYHGDLAAGDYASRKFAGPVETATGMFISAASGSKGGPWHLDFDEQNNVTRVTEGGNSTAVKLHSGLKKQRFINIGAAGRKLIEFDCGEFRVPRAAVPLMLTSATRDQLVDSKGDARVKLDGVSTSTVTVRFDVASMTQIQGTSVVQGPAYALTPIPGEHGQAIGVCEYGYYFSRLDFTKLATEHHVHRTYLPMPGGGAMPAQVGLGSYSTMWSRHNDALWLYVPGYTGMTRLKYAEHGKVREEFTADMFYERLTPRAIDGFHRDNIKDFREIMPALGGHMLDIGRGRPGRGGGAFSNGLELFNPRTLGASEVAVAMTRCFDIWTPVSRVVVSTKDGTLRQQIFAASSTIRPDYVRDLTERGNLPASQEPKIFAYECDASGHLRDLFGFTLPHPANGDNGSTQLAISCCGQYLVILQYGGALMTYSIAQQRFIDAVQLADAGGKPVQPIELSRPSACIWSAPNGQLFIATAQENLTFHEVTISKDGRIAVQPHIVVHRGKAAHAERVVRCFMPDLLRRDGSYDFIIGGRHQGDDPSLRVIEDFVLPRK